MSSKAVKWAVFVAGIILASTISAPSSAENCANYKAKAEALWEQSRSAPDHEYILLTRRAAAADELYRSCKNRSAQAQANQHRRQHSGGVDAGAIINFGLNAFGAFGGGGGNSGGHQHGQ